MFPLTLIYNNGLEGGCSAQKAIATKEGLHAMAFSQFASILGKLHIERYAFYLLNKQSRKMSFYYGDEDILFHKENTVFLEGDVREIAYAVCFADERDFSKMVAFLMSSNKEK